ncbi:serine hydrolase domain-containing protein [Actinoplanes sp. NPDC051633]|uniref:serine hydrolase domain-containing protein n=1 Tax=Actinoplanes sp. NPDC051633 TaxID=3155670 RepID=UPI0034217C48
MPTLPDAMDAIAEQHGFAGVVSVDRDGQIEFVKAYGFAHRGYRIPNTVDTRFGIASGTKGMTALTVVSLIEQDALGLSTTARSVLGEDLPLIGDDVTIEHLLAHRSGIGDYVDEEAGYEVTDYVMSVPVHELATTEQYLAVLDGHPAKFPAGERFCYCNSGYVVLALIAERVSGVPFPDLVRQRVCAPAGMRDTEFLRSDELPGRTAVGYLPIEGVSRTNVLHLPVRGSGDGGIYSTAADISSFWRAVFAGAIVSGEWVADMTRPRSDVPQQSRRYGLGFWLHGSRDAVSLVGSDAGVSFRTVHDPSSNLTHTVISNTSDGAWPMTQGLDELLGI